jgi:hypothetical protein
MSGIKDVVMKYLFYILLCLQQLNSSEFYTLIAAAFDARRELKVIGLLQKCI